MNQNPSQLMPFPAGSQFSSVAVNQSQYTGVNTPFNIELGKVGMLSTLFAIVNLTFTRTAGAGAVATVRGSGARTQAGFGYPASISRVSLRNNVNIRPTEVSFYAAWLNAMTSIPDWNPDLFNVNGLWSQSAANLAAANASTLTVSFVIPLLVATSEYGQAGLLANQDTAITYNVAGTWGNPIADMLVGDTASIAVTGSIAIESDYWSIRPVGTPYGLPSLSYAQTYTEEIFTPSANGRYRIDIPGGPAYLSTIIEVVNNGAPVLTGDMGAIELYQSANTMLRSISPAGTKAREFRRIGRALPDGCYLLDYAHIFGGTEAFSPDALMQTQTWTDGHFFVNLPAAWVAGNNSYIRVVHRALVGANG